MAVTPNNNSEDNYVYYNGRKLRKGFTTGTTQTGYASAIAYVLFLIILTVSVIQVKFFNRKED